MWNSQADRQGSEHHSYMSRGQSSYVSTAAAPVASAPNQAYMKQLESELESMRKTVQLLEARLSSHSIELKMNDLEDKNMDKKALLDVTAARDTATAELAESKRLVALLQAQLSSKASEMMLLTEKTARMSEKASTADVKSLCDIAEFEANLVAKDLTIQDLRSNIQSLEAKLVETEQAEIRHQVSTETVYQGRVAQLEKEIITLKKVVALLEAELETERRAVQLAEQKASASASSTAASTAEYNLLLETQHASTTMHTSEVDSLRLRVSTLQEENAAIKDDTTRLKDALELATEKANVAIVSTSEVDALRLALTTLKEENAAIKGDTTRLKTALEFATQKGKEDEATLEVARKGKEDEATLEVARLKEKLAAMEIELSESVELYQKHTSILEAEKERMQAEVASEKEALLLRNSSLEREQIADLSVNANSIH